MRKMSHYPNSNNPTVDTPNGTFRNESEPNKADGTDIKAEHMQDPYYALYQILQLAGEVPNGELENGGESRQFIRSLTNIAWFKYDSDIEYKKGTVVINTVNHITKLYRSQKDRNKDALTNTNSWISIITINADNTIALNTTSTDNAGVFIGAFMYGIRKDTPEGWLRCDGNDYPANAFAGFVNNYLLKEKIPYLSIEEWEVEYNKNNGNCGYFGYKPETIDEYNLDEDGNPIVVPSILRTPCFRDQLYITTALNSGNISRFTEAGLPNITGQISVSVYTRRADGAFAKNGTSIQSGWGWDQLSSQSCYTFDASRSSGAYGKSNTVTTDNIGYPVFVCVSNQILPVSEAQYNGFIEGLNDRVKIDGSNAKLNSLSPEAKSTLITTVQRNMAPNYSAGIALSGNSPFTVKATGWVLLRNDRHGASYINGTQVVLPGNYTDQPFGWHFVLAGDVCTTSNSWQSAVFYPCRSSLQ